MAENPTQGQEDVAAPARPAVGRGSLHDLPPDPRRPDASLGTATKLARGLRELRDDADTTQYLGLVTTGSTNPTARVEYALRADELLSEAQVRQIMEYYLAVRMRRYGRSIQPTESSKPSGSDRPTDRSLTRPVSETAAAAGGLRNGTATLSSVRPVVRSLREPGRY